MQNRGVFVLWGYSKCIYSPACPRHRKWRRWGWWEGRPKEELEKTWWMSIIGFGFLRPWTAAWPVASLETDGRNWPKSCHCQAAIQRKYLVRLRKYFMEIIVTSDENVGALSANFKRLYWKSVRHHIQNIAILFHSRDGASYSTTTFKVIRNGIER